MENQYNQLLALSKTVGAFYENVYSPVIQTLPWIDKGEGLKTASEKVLGNLAFPAFEFSTYAHQKESQETIDCLRKRCDELQSIYQQMQNELRPLLDKLPPQDRTWEKLQEMVPKWKNVKSSDLLSFNMHRAVAESFASSSPGRAMELIAVKASGPPISPSDAVLGKLMAEKIRLLHEKGESNHAISVAFGSHGMWLDSGFLNRLR